MADLRTSLQQLGHVWSQWSFGRRMFVVFGSALGIAGFLAVVAMSGRIDYSPLMTGMEPDDAAKVSEALADLKIPYRIDHNGGTIMVPADKIHEVRMKLAGAGLPKGGGVGFEIFDDPGFGMSRFAEQLNYKRALEGELRRTIKTVGAVKEARVHIVLPKRQLFRGKERSASASITVHMRKGRRLSEEQVAAVVHLVSSSVEGLSPEEITLVDSAGRVLAKGGDGMTSLNKGLEHQRRIERDLENRAIEILERVIGMGRVSAQVSAELDFTQSENTEERYDPELVAVRSEQVNDEERSLSSKDANGIPGARSNLTGAEGEAGQGGGNADTKRSTIRNYEITKNVKRELNEVAKLERISIAVLVDGIRTKDAEKEGAETYSERSPEEIAKLTALVKSAVGFNAARGDQVTLESMAFSPVGDSTPVVEEGMGLWGYFNMLWRPISALLFLILLIGVMRATRRLTDGPAQILEAPKSVRELEAALGGASAVALPGAQQATNSPKIRPQPDKAAAVIKGWLSEG